MEASGATDTIRAHQARHRHQKALALQLFETGPLVFINLFVYGVCAHMHEHTRTRYLSLFFPGSLLLSLCLSVFLSPSFSHARSLSHTQTRMYLRLTSAGSLNICAVAPRVHAVTRAGSVAQVALRVRAVLAALQSRCQVWRMREIRYFTQPRRRKVDFIKPPFPILQRGSERLLVHPSPADLDKLLRHENGTTRAERRAHVCCRCSRRVAPHDLTYSVFSMQ